MYNIAQGMDTLLNSVNEAIKVGKIDKTVDKDVIVSKEDYERQKEILSQVVHIILNREQKK